MCTNKEERHPSPPLISTSKRRQQPPKKSRVRVLALTRRRCEEKEGKDMELKNLKLYLENQSIVEENDKLRKKANLLHQENLALMSELQKKFPNHFGHRISTSLILLSQTLMAEK